MQQEDKNDYKTLYLQEKTKVKHLQETLELEKIKFKKFATNKMKGKVCPKCYSESQGQKQATNIKEDLIGFSEKINDVLVKKTKNHHPKQSSGHLRRIQTMNANNPNFDTPVLKEQIIDPLAMINNFTIFGVCEQNIKKTNQKLISQGLEPQLLYSYRSPSSVDHQASKLIFPSGIALKNVVGLKAKDKAIQMMSFCYTNLKSFVLRFKCQQNVDLQQFQKNPFLQHVNPEKALFCLCIGISDYTTVQNTIKELSFKKMTSLGIIDGQSFNQQDSKRQELTDDIGSTSLGQHKDQGFPSNNSNNSDYFNCKITMSQRVFCISSYYPFFTFYEDILRNLINIVKMERLMIYKHKGENIQETDSLFQLSRMKQLFVLCMNDLNSKKVVFNRSYELKLINQQKLTLLTDWNLAKTFFIEQWVFAVLNMFNIDTFIDVLTLVMLQDRIVFICENSHILTYTLYLFSSLMLRPFVYAFEIVSIIPEEDFLGAPFPVIYGMLKKRKYVLESHILQDYKNTYIFLSPEKVDILYTQNKKHLLKCKPQRLKSQLSNYFRDLKKFRKPEIKNSKYELEASQYALSSMIQERQMAVQIIQKVNLYMLHEVVNKLPNPIQINNIKNSIVLEDLPAEKDEHSYLMEEIKSTVRKNVKDAFIEKLLETQMMSIYVWK